MNLVVLQTADFINSDTIRIFAQDDRYKHIKKILKLAIGDTFKAGLIHEHIGHVCITLFSETLIEGTYQPHQQESTPYPIHLLLGATRPIVMKRLVKDITSMGITSLGIFASENGEKSYLESHFWRNHEVQRSIIEGLSQGFHIHPPRITLFNSLQEALDSYAKYTTSYKLILDPYSTDKWPTTVSSAPLLDTILLVGSERGFTNKEMVIAQNYHYQPISLTKNILRTETAVIAALSLAIHTYENDDQAPHSHYEERH